MGETREIATFVCRMQYERLPVDLVGDFKIFILDTLAAAFVGSVQPWCKTVLDMLWDLRGSAQASIINHDGKLDISRAAFANGTLISGFECEPLTGTHASATVFPAAMAVCEHEHLDGRALITSVIAGTEISARIARTAVGLETHRGFHNAGIQGPIAAAVAAGWLYRLNESQLVNAIGIAGSSSAGLLEFIWEGANTKRIHAGRASQLGLESALLAKRGFSGPSTVLEGRYGFFNAFSLPPKLENLLSGIGEHWAVQPLSLKLFPSHVTHQAVVQAIQNLKLNNNLKPEEIIRIVIKGDEHIMEERHSLREPISLTGAQYSLPFTTAVALTTDMSNPLNYNERALWDPLVRDLAKRVELIPMPRSTPVELTIELKQATLRALVSPSKGSPKNPFNWDDAVAKFRRYTAGILAPHRAQAIVNAVKTLDEYEDVANFTQLVTGKNRLAESA